MSRLMKKIVLLSIALLINYFSCYSQFSGIWSELGTGANGLNVNLNDQTYDTTNNTAHINALVTDRSGNVYAAGNFGGNGSNYVAKWNGTNWKALGNLNTDSSIYSLAVDPSGNVYAAGNFINSSGNWYVAKWNGSVWTELGNNTLNANGFINTIATDNAGNVYAAGTFSDVNQYTYVAKWNGSNWSELGTGANVLNSFGAINSIAADNSGNVYAVGNFYDTTGFYVAHWNGTNWSELGDSKQIFVSAEDEAPISYVATDNYGNVYATGGFLDSYGYYYITKWNGSSWSEMGTGSNILKANNQIQSIVADSSGNIYVGGNFINSNGNHYVAKWNGTSWNELGLPNNTLNANNDVCAIAADRYENIYAAGSFTDTSKYQYVAKFIPLPTTSNVTYCQYATASSLSANVIGTKLTWYTDSTIATGSTVTPITQTISPGDTTYYVSQTINGNESPRVAITVTINPTPLPPIPLSPAKDTVFYCQNAPSVHLTATGSSLKWYMVDTLGSPLASAPIPLTSLLDTTTYYVSQTINGCESRRDSIAVIVSAITEPPIDTIGVVTYCQFDTAKVLSASGTHLSWYKKWSGGDSLLISAPIPPTNEADTIQYYVTQTINGCQSVGVTTTLIVYAIPPFPLTSDTVNYYPGDTAKPLLAIGINSSYLSWYKGDSLLTTDPVPQTIKDTSTTYFVTQTINGCTSPKDTIIVIVSTIPPAPTVIDTTYCIYATPMVVKAFPHTKSDTLTWYTNDTIANGSSSAPIPSTLHVDTSYYYVSQTHNGIEGIRGKLSVIVYPIPAPPVVSSPVSYCVNTIKPSALSATIIKGSIEKWYSSDSITFLSETSPIPKTTIVDTINYFVSQTVYSCESRKAEIEVIINASATASITVGSKLPFCTGNSILLTSSQAYSYSWKLGTTSVGTNSDTLIISQGGNYTVTVSDSAKGCSGTSPIKVITQTPDLCFDCAGVLNGKATVDNCGRCTGGSTPFTACDATAIIPSRDPSAILIYPNPFENNTLIELTNGEIIQSINIYNSLGALVYNQENINNSFIKLGDNLSSGMYSVVIQSDNGIYAEKIIKY